MNVLFMTVSSIQSMNGHSISIDLLHEFQRSGHTVYVVCALENAEKATYVAQEAGCTVLRVKTEKYKTGNVIVKGAAMVSLPYLYIHAIKKHFADVKFDLILYATPPISHAKSVEYFKNRDGAKTYLLLKDIFPQNAVDIGMMRKSGVKGILYRHFRKQEKLLYALSDHIGCMSQGNVDYLIKHNPEISPDIVGICPNSIEIQNMAVTAEEKSAMREKYGIPQDKTVFVYGGNLGKPQGIPFIIECLRREKDNTNAFFLIVGGGTEYGKLEAFVREEAPANVKLMQRLPKEDYDRLVAACDVGLIFLDHRFTIPNFPSRLLGYLQAGLPILAATDPNTDVGKVITDGGFGWWCESDDTEAFHRCIAEAANADTQAMGETGYAYLQERYSVEKAYQTIMESMK